MNCPIVTDSGKFLLRGLKVQADLIVEVCSSDGQFFSQVAKFLGFFVSCELL